jgi:hypothetical protein
VAVDVIIDPSNGQIYWNDNQATAQSIALSGNASDAINFIGYSGAFGGSTPGGAATRVTVNDSASATLVPGTNGHELGSDTLRWAVSATSISASGTVTITGGATNTNDLLSITNGGTIKVEGNVAGQRGIRLTLRGAGNQTVDQNILSIGNAAGDHSIFNISADGTTGYGLQLNSSSSGYPLSVKFINDSTTDTVKEVVSVERTTSATAANGIGSSIIFKTQNDNGALVRNLAIEGILASAALASYRGAFVFKTNGSGSETLTEKVRISYNNILLSPYDAGSGTYELRFNALTGSNYVGFKAPNSIASSVMWTLPSTVGTSGQFLKVGASGVLSWDTPVAGTGTVTSITAGTGLTGGTITTSGTIAIDTSVVPTLTATTNSLTSGNSTGATTSSAFSLTANSLTTGTGAYFASNSVTSGRLVDIALSGNTGAGTRYGLSVAVSGANTTGTTSYGVFSNVTATVSATNIAAGLFSSGGTNNVPLRLGLNTNFYTNFFVNADGNGITLSPTGNGTPFLSLAGYASTVQEFRLCTDGGGTGNNYIGLKAPLSLAASKVWTLPSTDGSATATSLSLLATNNSGVLSFPTNVKYDSSSQTLSATLLSSTQSATNEGGEIQLALPSSGSTLSTSVTIDVYQNRLRFFETGTNTRGAYIDLTACTNGVGTNLLSGTGTGSGTVNSGASGKIAYYPSAGTTVDDASALDYATTGTNLTITASGIGVIPLAVTGITSQTAAIFKAILNTTDVFVINNTGAISTGTWNASTIGVSYGGTGQTTYTNGQLLIGNTSGNTLTKATLTAGSGVDITNGAGSIAIRQKRPLYLTFCAGFTPAASGVDSVVLRIPDSPADGSTSISYNVRELFIRVETPSSGTSSVQVEFYTGTSAFTATNMMSAALSITGASTYEASTTSFSQTTLASGNKVRLNFTALNSTHANFFVQLLLEEA